jgi:hypothetical protein
VIASPGRAVELRNGHSVAVLLRIYAKCISGHDAEAKRRILAATKVAKKPANRPKKAA